MAHKICDLDGTTYPTVVAFARAFGHRGDGDLNFVFSYLCAQCHHQLPAKDTNSGSSTSRSTPRPGPNA